MASITTLTPTQRSEPGGATATAPRKRRIAGKNAAGEVTVTLQRFGQGLLLECEERRQTGARIVVVTAFTAASSFDDWCADDPLRHQDPNVHHLVRRHAEELWQSHA